MLVKKSVNLCDQFVAASEQQLASMQYRMSAGCRSAVVI